MTPTLRANNDLVAVAWLNGLPGLTGRVATTLPQPLPEFGFVQVQTVGGTPDLYLPVHRPVVQVDCWAEGTGAKPPWNVANLMVEEIWAATQNPSQRRTGDSAPPAIRRVLTLPTGYPTAMLLEAYFVSEPRRILNDAGSYARFQVDLQLHWVVAS